MPKNRYVRMLVFITAPLWFIPVMIALSMRDGFKDLNALLDSRQ